MTARTLFHKLLTLPLMLMLLGLTQASAEGVIVPNPPQLAAKAWVLLDFDSGRVLADYNPDGRVEPASLTKLMTAYLVFQELAAKRLQLDDLVPISEKAWRQPGSRSFLRVGNRVPLEVLLRGMITQSGNDASVALAEKLAGSEEVFAQLMNETAKKLGMNNSNFLNATGLPDPNHYTTANDLATLARAIVQDYPQYYKWYSEKEFVWNDIRQPNRNRLLWQDESVDGMKTGHTESAGYCLVASAKRGDMRLISVILGADSDKARTQESQKLLNYGFRFYETHKLYDPQKSLSKVRVWQGELDEVSVGSAQSVYLTIPRGQYEQLKPVIEFAPHVVAPLAKGQEVGTLKVTLGDEVLAKMPLVTQQEVPAGGFFKRAIDQARLAIQTLMGNK